MLPAFRHRTTKKEPRRSRWPAAALEERIEEIMDRVQKAGDNHVGRVAALEEYLTLARAHEGETWFDAGAWTEDLADSYLALGRVDDAVRAISDATRSGYPDDVWIYVQAGTGCSDVGDHAEALEWLTTGLELALRTGDPESALDQLRPLRTSCLSALGRPSGEIQERAAQGEQGNTGER